MTIHLSRSLASRLCSRFAAIPAAQFATRFVSAFSSRSVLPVVLALGGATALLAAPATARAESAAIPAVSTSAGDCAACRAVAAYDRDGVTFQDVEAEPQDGEQLVLTATVEVLGPSGKPRTGSVVFSAFPSYGPDGHFMDYTDDACMFSQLSRQAGLQACAALSQAVRSETAVAGARSGAMTAPVSAPATIPTTVAPNVPTTVPVTGPGAAELGIIMRDGGICDPIRHIGC